MPVSVDTRRRTRRVPTEDDIEDESLTQNRLRQEESVITNQTNGRGGDTDEEDDQQPRRAGQARNGRRATAGPSTSVASMNGNGNGTTQLDDDDPLKDFQDAPLDKSHLEKLRGLASDWTMTRTHIHDPAFGTVNDVAASIAEFEEGNKAKKVSD